MKAGLQEESARKNDKGENFELAVANLNKEIPALNDKATSLEEAAKLKVKKRPRAQGHANGQKKKVLNQQTSAADFPFGLGTTPGRLMPLGRKFSTSQFFV